MDRYLKRPRFWFSERQVGRFFEEEGRTSVSAKWKTLGDCIGWKTRNARQRIRVVFENLFKRVVLSQSHVSEFRVSKEREKRNSKLRMFHGSFNRWHNLKCTPVLIVGIRRATEIRLDQWGHQARRVSIQTNYFIAVRRDSHAWTHFCCFGICLFLFLLCFFFFWKTLHVQLLLYFDFWLK